MFTVELVINENCNYKCDYCYIRNNNHINKLIDFDFLESKLNEYKVQNEFIDFYILGGEPTLHPEFRNLILYLKTKSFVNNITVQSNLTFDVEKYKDLDINFAISFHLNDVKDINLFYKKVLLLKKYKQLNEVNVMWHSHFDKIILHNVIKNLNSLKIKNTLEPTYDFNQNLELQEFYKSYDYKLSGVLNKSLFKPEPEVYCNKQCGSHLKWRTLNLIDGINEEYVCTTYFIKRFRPNKIDTMCNMPGKFLCTNQ